MTQQVGAKPKKLKTFSEIILWEMPKVQNLFYHKVWSRENV